MKKGMMSPSEVKSTISSLRCSKDHPSSDQSAGPKLSTIEGRGSAKGGGGKKGGGTKKKDK